MSIIDDSKLDFETQRRIEYTRQKLQKVEQIEEQLKKLKKSNLSSQEKLERITKRKDSLEKDLERLQDVSINIEAEACADLLNSAEKEPMDLDIACAVQFRNKMSQLKVLLGEIIVRTCFNEKAMCTEIGHQEADFELRLLEAIEARKTIVLKNIESQKKHQLLTKEYAEVYEMCETLAQRAEQFDASRWLLNAESRRVSDMLDKTKCDPKLGRDDKPIHPAWAATSNEQILSSAASLKHSHDGDQRSKIKNAEARLKPDDRGLISHRSSIRLKYEAGNVSDADLDSNIILENEISDIPSENGGSMVPVEHSNSLFPEAEIVETKKICPIHGNMKKVDNFEDLELNGIDLMKLISKVIEEEYS